MRRLLVNDTEFLPKWEAAWLEGLASTLPDPVAVMEVGTGKGNSFTAIAYGLSLHKDWHIWTVDIGECVEGRKRIIDSMVPPERYTFTRANSLIYAESLVEWLDLLYVDGDHSYIGVKADILSYASHVREGGIAVFDDYCDTHHGVMRAIDENMSLPHWLYIGQVGRCIAFEKR